MVACFTNRFSNSGQYKRVRVGYTALIYFNQSINQSINQSLDLYYGDVNSKSANDDDKEASERRKTACVKSLAVSVEM